MATIKISDEHRLRGDEYQWVFERKTARVDKKGNGVWVVMPCAYHSTFANAIKNAYRYFLRTSDATTLLELEAVSDKLHKQFNALDDPGFD